MEETKQNKGKNQVPFFTTQIRDGLELNAFRIVDCPSRP